MSKHVCNHNDFMSEHVYIHDVYIHDVYIYDVYIHDDFISEHACIVE